MQSVLSRIWTCVAVSISYDDNDYTTGTSAISMLLPKLCSRVLNMDGQKDQKPLTFLLQLLQNVMANVFDCNIVESMFKLKSHYYIHFQTNTLGKGMNPHIPPAMG